MSNETGLVRFHKSRFATSVTLLLFVNLFTTSNHTFCMGHFSQVQKAQKGSILLYIICRRRCGFNNQSAILTFITNQKVRVSSSLFKLIVSKVDLVISLTFAHAHVLTLAHCTIIIHFARMRELFLVQDKSENPWTSNERFLKAKFIRIATIVLKIIFVQP